MICVNLKITNFYTGPSLRAFGAPFRPVRMALYAGARRTIIQMRYPVYKIAKHTQGRSYYEHGNFSENKGNGERVKGEKKK